MILTRPIRIREVLSFTSEDVQCKAKNMETSHAWFCSKRNKSGRLEGEFQLDSRCPIFKITLYNNRSHTIEILVGRSTKSKSRPTEYKTYLPTFTMFELGTSRTSLLSVFEFTEQHFVKSLFKKKWDRIKIVLTQSRKESQFGLNALLLYENIGLQMDYEEFGNVCQKIEETYDKEQDKKFKKQEEKFLKNGACSRTVPIYTLSPCLSPFQKVCFDTSIRKTKKEASDDFKREATNFMKKRKFSLFFLRFVDYLEEFELHRDEPLTLQEKHILYDLYLKYVGESIWDDKEKIFSDNKDDCQDLFEEQVPKINQVSKDTNVEYQESMKLTTITKEPALTKSFTKKLRPSKRSAVDLKRRTGKLCNTSKSKRIIKARSSSSKKEELCEVSGTASTSAGVKFERFTIYGSM